MSTNPRGVTPFSWQALVAEAMRRRKAEKMTQREHAALASVSIPRLLRLTAASKRSRSAKPSTFCGSSDSSKSRAKEARKKRSFRRHLLAGGS